MKCMNCNVEIETAKFCPYCGTKQESKPVDQPQHTPPDFYNQYKNNDYQQQNNVEQQNPNPNYQVPPVMPNQQWQGYNQNNYQQPQQGDANYQQQYYNQQGYNTQQQYQQPQVNVNVTQQNETPQYMASYKSRLAALILCAIVGVLGVHRFYAGKIGTGILWLCTGGFFGIGYIVDIILIATGSFTDSHGYPILYW